MKHVLVVCGEGRPRARTYRIAKMLFKDSYKFHLMGISSPTCRRDVLVSPWSCPDMPSRLDMIMFEGCPRMGPFDVVVASTLRKAYTMLAPRGVLVVDAPRIRLGPSNVLPAQRMATAAVDLSRYGFVYAATIKHMGHESGVYRRQPDATVQRAARQAIASRV